MNRVTHFEIASGNPDKTAAFYREVFDWNIAKWPGADKYWTISTGPDAEEGIDGGIYRKRAELDQPVSVSILVDSIDQCIERVRAQGGTVLVPKRAIEGVGWLAYCRDCDGTLFCLHQEVIAKLTD